MVHPIAASEMGAFLKRLLDFDPWSKMSTYHEYKPGTDETIITTVQDAEPNLEWSTGLQKDDAYTRKGMKKDLLHYAHIPTAKLMELMLQGVDINDTNALFEYVNRRENEKMRTTTMKHGPGAKIHAIWK